MFAVLGGLGKNALGPLVLRLGLAAICLFYGLDKVSRPGAEGGAHWHWTGPLTNPLAVAQAAATGRPLEPQGPQPLPKSAQLAIAWAEIALGIALVVGILTRLAALGGALVIAVESMYTVRWHFSLPQGFALLTEDGKFADGYEYTVLVYIVCAAVLFLGGGSWAIDRWLFKAFVEKPPAPPGG